ncbi:hypothetical protein EDD21DRAFT_410215 [Dissophora ornata]|nr:hypothetical protein BGZ58_007645 [Dissophora ornata]KAI8606407.1 hypothetical protein EDD21DRAFT_410215 [Dissophora ornata]
MIRCSISLGNNRLPLLLSYILATILHISLSPFVHAQTFQPPVVFSPLNVFIEGQALYISGGGTVPVGSKFYTPTSLSFMMDLSVSWNASSPVLKKLPDGPSTLWMPSALSSDAQNWLAIVNGTGYVYNFKSAAWSSIFTSSNISGAGPGLAAATDPETGLVYVPNGYRDAANTASMLRVNLTAKTFDNVPMSNYSALNTTVEYSVAWSTPLRSMIFVGGSLNGIFVYSPSTGWSNPAAKGTIPPLRSGACLVPANGGSKMILFGGYSYTGNSSLNDIYFLDVATLTWTNGPNVTLADKRTSAACAVSNDNFIVWGGYSSDVQSNAIASSTALVYDLKANIWTSSYVAPPLNSSTPAASSSGPSKTSDIPGPNTAAADASASSGSNSHVVVIVGVIIGVLLVVLIGLGLALYRVRSKKGFNLSNPKNDPYTTSTSFGRDFMPPSHNPGYPLPPPPVASTSWSAASLRDTTTRGPTVFIEDHHYDDRGPSATSGRLQEGYHGANPRSQHPQAISEHPHVHLGVRRGQDSSLGASHYLQPFVQHPDNDKEGLIADDGLLDAYYELQPAQPQVNIKQPRVDDSAYHIPKSQFQRRLTYDQR